MSSCTTEIYAHKPLLFIRLTGELQIDSKCAHVIYLKLNTRIDSVSSMSGYISACQAHYVCSYWIMLHINMLSFLSGSHN